MRVSKPGPRPSRAAVEAAPYLYPGYLECRAKSDWLLSVGDDHHARVD